MSKFFPLKVSKIEHETDDCVSVAFAVPAGLEDIFRFIHGQHLTLKVNIDGEDVRRSYSLCVRPDEGLKVAVKKLPGGKFSGFVHDRLKPGDTLEVFPPQGHFYTLPNGVTSKTYVAFAAGSGITPVMSILKTLLREEPSCRFLLFYGNRSSDSIIFKEDLDALKSKYFNRLSIHHILSREKLESPLFSGRIDPEKLSAYARYYFNPEEVDAFFLCGPEAMIFSLRDALKNKGVDEKKIHFELFTTPTTGNRVGKPKPEAEQFDPQSEAQVRIILDGASMSFTMPYGEGNILEAALDAGADVPFSCKGGVCCTCKAKLEEGKVDMDTVYGLEEDEIKNGFVLTCQSQPRSEFITVNYDMI
jgi:ring-1,2-phenylacetyl-CoA epoxidase subunit PaaE